MNSGFINKNIKIVSNIKFVFGLIISLFFINNNFCINLKATLPALIKKIEKIEDKVYRREESKKNNDNNDNKEEIKAVSKNSSEESKNNLKKDYDPFCCVVLMVKNESENVIKTLQPFIDGGINNIFVFDTGSTDGTQDLVKKYFKEKNINGVLMEEPFIDFSASRNRALRLAEERFPDTTFMIMPDAEWYLNDAKKLVEYLKPLARYDYKGYYVRLLSEGIDFYIPRIFKAHTNANFKGVVHEVLDADLIPKLPQDIYFNVNPTRNGIEKSRKRWERDRDLLKREHEKDPKDARTCYYLAQTYACLRDFENAIKYFKIRDGLKGWSEENYMAKYMLGYLHALIGDNNRAIEYYQKAYEYRPVRGEALVRVAQLYNSIGQKNIAYIYAVKACEIKYPENDILFVEKDTYETVRYEVLLQTAWDLEEYDAALWATREFLKNKPDDINMKKNIDIINAKKAEFNKRKMSAVAA